MNPTVSEPLSEGVSLRTSESINRVERANHRHGIGIEVLASTVRAVRLDGDRPGQVVTSGSVSRRDGPGGLVDALIRVAVAVQAPAGAGVRLAWFPTGASIEGRDVTAEHPATVAQLLARWSAVGDGATVVTERDGRRFVGLVRWPCDELAELLLAAAQAGLDDVECEPSPLALARLLPDRHVTVTRDSAETGWHARVVDGVVQRAHAVAAPAPTAPQVDPASIELAPIGGGGHGAPLEVATWALADTGRDAVALGAALGAAGLGGGPLVLRSLGRADGVPGWRPWAVEPVVEQPPAEPPSPARRWHHRLVRRRTGAGGCPQ